MYSSKLLLPLSCGRNQGLKICPLEEIHDAEHSFNPIDIFTSTTASVDQFSLESFHQTVPEFFCAPLGDLPVSRHYHVISLPMRLVYNISDRNTLNNTLCLSLGMFIVLRVQAVYRSLILMLHN